MEVIEKVLASFTILLGAIIFLDKTLGRERTELVVTFLITFAIIVFLLFSPAIIVGEITGR